MSAIWRYCLVAALLAPFPIEARDASPLAYSQGILWKIERPGLAPSYLFGTIHSEDSRVLALPQPVQAAFNNAKTYVMEALLDENSMALMTGEMMFSDGRTLQQVLSATTYAKTVSAVADYGLPEMAARLMKPWALAMTLSMPKPKTGVVLDLALMQQAREQGKRTAGLETVEEQLDILDKLSMREQVIMLEDTLNQLPDQERIFAALHEAYLARDLARMVRLSEAQQEKGDRELGKKVMEQLVDKRNRRMADRMENYLKPGNAFIAIGALHLPGELGVLNLLAKKGYRVSAVY